MIIKMGKKISRIIVGNNRNPGILNPSIQVLVSIKLKILLYPENKKTDEIKILPIRSIKLPMDQYTFILVLKSKREWTILGFFRYNF